jgi:hypothetical protein
MKTELLKQLKDAGFPIKPYPAWAVKGDGLVSEAEWRARCVPTLIELIEACGEFDSYHVSRNGDQVELHFDNQEKGICENAFGEDLDSAFANLWFALNKK